MRLYLEDEKPSVGVFQEFHALVERQTSKKLKCIRSDNGDEYCGPFDEYFQNMIFYIKRSLRRLLCFMD